MRSSSPSQCSERARTFAASLILSLLSPGFLQAEDEKPAGQRSPYGEGRVIFNDGLQQGIQALAKGFCVNLRDYYSKEPLQGRYADKIRKYLDPKYLQKHNLEEGDLPILTTPFRRLDDIRVSDDLKTIFCVVDNDAGRKEVILMRVVIKKRDEKYSYASIRPANPPDSKTGFFAPWVLKAEISNNAARYALPVPKNDEAPADSNKENSAK